MNSYPDAAASRCEPPLVPTSTLTSGTYVGIPLEHVLEAQALCGDRQRVVHRHGDRVMNVQVAPHCGSLGACAGGVFALVRHVCLWSSVRTCNSNDATVHLPTPNKHRESLCWVSHLLLPLGPGLAVVQVRLLAQLGGGQIKSSPVAENIRSRSNPVRTHLRGRRKMKVCSLSASN